MGFIKTSEPIELQFALLSWLGHMNRALERWHHLANTVDRLCGG